MLTKIKNYKYFTATVKNTKLFKNAERKRTEITVFLKQILAYCGETRKTHNN